MIEVIIIGVLLLISLSLGGFLLMCKGDAAFWQKQSGSWMELSSDWKKITDRLLDNSRNRYGYALCERCGQDCGMDAVIPTDIWKQINPRGDENGMLCVWCIDELCLEKGLTATACLYFTGKAVSSAMPDPEERERMR